MAKCEVVVELGSATWVTMVLFSILFLVLKKCICICVHTHTHMYTYENMEQLCRIGKYFVINTRSPCCGG